MAQSHLLSSARTRIGAEFSSLVRKVCEKGCFSIQFDFISPAIMVRIRTGWGIST